MHTIQCFQSFTGKVYQSQASCLKYEFECHQRKLLTLVEALFLGKHHTDLTAEFRAIDEALEELRTKQAEYAALWEPLLKPVPLEQADAASLPDNVIPLRTEAAA